MYDMISSLQKMIKRKRLEVPRKTKIHREEMSVQERMEEIMAGLKNHSGRHSFTDLYAGPDREHIVTTFLAVLELMKKRKITCRQENNFADFMIYQTPVEEQINAARIYH